MIIIDYSTHFLITVPYDRWFKVNIAAVKQLDMIPIEAGMFPAEAKRGLVKWIADKKVWYVPNELRPKVVEMAAKRRAAIQPYEVMAPEMVGQVRQLPDLEIELPIKAMLRPYQRQGIARAMQLRRLIIGDEPGLGKTIQSISALVGLREQGESVFPCLVIAPATTKENWKREWEKWSDHKAAILTDNIKNTWPQYCKAGFVDVFITNYESLKKYFVESMPDKSKLKLSKQIIMKEVIKLFKSVVIDESHKVKDPSALQTKLCARITQGKEDIILLSGTPVMSRPIELYTQLVILNQMHHFGNTKKAFSDRYCDGGKGSSNLRELNYLLNEHCFFRREKKDVAKDLPDKQRQQIVCDITTRAEYEFAEKNFEKFLLNSGATQGQIDKKMRAEALVKINELKQISARGKIKEAKEFIDEVVDANEKLIVFCNLKSIVSELKKIYPDAGTITGSDTQEQRQRYIDSFQNDPKSKLIICNFKAAGVGITLTASSRVLFMEYPWTYAELVQAEDRAHRIGQKNAVMCTFLLGQGTIDERMFELIIEKKDIANAITGGTDEMEMATVDKMINLFTKKAVA